MDKPKECDALAESMLYVKAPDLVNVLENLRLDMPRGTNADRFILFLARCFPHELLKYYDALYAPPPLPPSVIALIKEDKRISAIKEYVKVSGVHLAEAKDYVDDYIDYLKSREGVV